MRTSGGENKAAANKTKQSVGGMEKLHARSTNPPRAADRNKKKRSDLGVAR
jgi:hypothetical protein